jgi:hypothetical protein
MLALLESRHLITAARETALPECGQPEPDETHVPLDGGSATGQLTCNALRFILAPACKR